MRAEAAPGSVFSFIIPAHNEARLVGGTTDALHAAAARGDRVVFVDADTIVTPAERGAR